MNELEELKKAVEDEDKAKRIVLKILHTRGLIAFDASESTVDPEWETISKGKG